MSTRDELRQASELLRDGKPQDGYRTLTLALRGSDPLAESGALLEATTLLAAFSRTFGDADLAAKLDAAKSGAPQALYIAAYDLYEQRQFAAAGALLFRANAIAPGQRGIVNELAGCLEKQMRYGEAVRVLDAAKLTDPMSAYLAGFNGLMAGHLERARAAVARLRDEPDDQIAFMRAQLEGMVARADALLAAEIVLDDRALSAWQAVIDGSVLLHESPHGHPDPMRGRYAYVADSAGLEREGLERLRAVLAATGTRVDRIIAAPERGSKIMSLAASRLFDVPCIDWTPDDAGAGLAIAWSMDSMPDVRFLQAYLDRRPGQTLFVHASSWTEPFAYAPDVTTLLHQQATSPWTGGAMRIDPETKGIVRAAPDDRADEAIAAEILETPISDASVSSLELVTRIARALATVGVASGRRPIQRAGSPVPSNYFT